MLKEEIIDLKGSLKEMEEKVHEQSLALEMMAELKKVSRRWFIISIILLVALVTTNVAWLIYKSQWEYASEETTQTIEDVDNPNNSNFTQHIN